MKLTDVRSMQNIDKNMGDSGVPEIIPMEHAGKAIADVAAELLEDKEKVVVLCGKGNNGGDGFCAARWLLNYGKKVKCFGMGLSKNEALTEYGMLADSGVEIITMNTQADLDYCKMSMAQADLIIDALLGTGLDGELAGDYIEVCDIINNATCTVLSVDVPTGINADNGYVAEHAVKADVTVTLARVKVGMLLYPAREYVGELLVADIGFPPKLLAMDKSSYYLADKKMLSDLLPVRANDAHKGDNGRVTVVAGSTGYVGAAALCTKGAVKSGAGLVTLLTPASSSQILAMKLDEEMVRPLDEMENGGLAESAVKQITDFDSSVLAIGPGLGTSENTLNQVREVIKTATVPMVIDADALTALAGHIDCLLNNKTSKVLTPHAGEFSRLTGLSVKEINANRLELAIKYAKKWSVVLLLKGAPTIVAMPNGAGYLVNSGSSSMATGGSGDVLTGVIAGLIAQGLDTETAAICGAYLHGLAGTMATAGNPGLAAGEIAMNIPNAWQEVFENDTEDMFTNRAVCRVQ